MAFRRGELVRERRRQRGLPLPITDKVLPFHPLASEVLATEVPAGGEATTSTAERLAEARMVDAGYAWWRRNSGTSIGIVAGLMCGLIAGSLVGAQQGGAAALQHLALRWVLRWAGAAPPHLVRFLDCAADHILLQRVGGGYRFIHILLRDYFADLKTDGVEQPGQLVNDTRAVVIPSKGSA